MNSYERLYNILTENEPYHTDEGVRDVLKKISGAVGGAVRGVKKELTREEPLFGPDSPYPLLRGRKPRNRPKGDPSPPK